jgi:hypothetical protein
MANAGCHLKPEIRGPSRCRQRRRSPLIEPTQAIDEFRSSPRREKRSALAQSEQFRKSLCVDFSDPAVCGCRGRYRNPRDAPGGAIIWATEFRHLPAAPSSSAGADYPIGESARVKLTHSARDYLRLSPDSGRVHPRVASVLSSSPSKRPRSRNKSRDPGDCLASIEITYPLSSDWNRDRSRGSIDGRSTVSRPAHRANG